MICHNKSPDNQCVFEGRQSNMKSIAMTIIVFIYIIYLIFICFTELIKMVVVKSIKLPAASSYPNVLLEDLKSSQLSSHDTVVMLSSGEDKVYVHTVLLVKASKLMCSVLGELCTCLSNPAIILPPSPPTTLISLKTLLYTGIISNMSKYHRNHVLEMSKQMGLDISIELIENDDNDDSDVGHNEVDNDSVLDVDPLKLGSTLLSIETIVIDQKCGDSVNLSFPKSRIKREASKNEVMETLSGFEGRVQKEYNTHPIGQYMGPYDQNEHLKLSIQLPNSNLDYKSYTEFIHSGGECYEFSVRSYEKHADHEKIDAYKIKARIGDLEEGFDDESYETKTGVKYYTCQYRKCKIPCLCPQCSLNQEQCTNHKMQHIALFDENKHAISIRSSSNFCLGMRFFDESYILKYPGIPINCRKCVQDLFFHHSYHFKFHEMCRFCKQTLYKLKARTEKEHHSLEKEEAQYYRTVCPYCDKRFCEAYHAKRHIVSKHEQAQVSFKCVKCEKVFLSLKAKEYHEMTKHSALQLSLSCDLCDATFSSEVNLKSHKKNVHSTIRKWSCPNCETRFKQKRDLKVHMLKIHGLDRMKEDYMEDQEQDLFKCEVCNLTFKYKKNLNAHVKTKHLENSRHFECEECPSKFKDRRNLMNHIRVKHKPDRPEHVCSVCGKVFQEKSNMRKHEKKHETI